MIYVAQFLGVLLFAVILAIVLTLVFLPAKRPGSLPPHTRIRPQAARRE